MAHFMLQVGKNTLLCLFIFFFLDKIQDEPAENINYLQVIRLGMALSLSYKTSCVSVNASLSLRPLKLR